MKSILQISNSKFCQIHLEKNFEQVHQFGGDETVITQIQLSLQSILNWSKCESRGLFIIFIFDFLQRIYWETGTAVWCRPSFSAQFYFVFFFSFFLILNFHAKCPTLSIIKLIMFTVLDEWEHPIIFLYQTRTHTQRFTAIRGYF